MFAAVLAALLASHNLGDHWVQTGRQAARKALPGWPGRRACAAHVATYTLTLAAALAIVAAVTGMSLSVPAAALGLAVSAVTHYLADRRTPLRHLAECLGLGGFWALGIPRAGRDDNPSLGTGAYALDQSWHWAWLFASALIITGGTR